MGAYTTRLLLTVTITILCGAGALHADWTKVRDMVRQGDKLADEKKQEQIFRQAYAMAQKSVAASPNASNEYLWVAISAGRLGLIAPIKERINLSKVVKDNAEKAIALDKSNGQAYMVLGAWHYYVADLSWVQKNAAKILYGGVPQASYQEAVKYLTQALKYGVENRMEVHYIRGLAYDEMDQEKASEADFRECLKGAPRNEKERKIQEDVRDRLD